MLRVNPTSLVLAFPSNLKFFFQTAITTKRLPHFVTLVPHPTHWLGILRLLIKLPRMTVFYLGVISVRRRKNQAVNQYGDGLCKYQDGSYKSCIFDSLGRDRGNRYWQIERA